MIDGTVEINAAVAITTFLLLSHPRRSLFILRNPEYAMQFTEKTTGDFIRHRGNAWTSIIYLLIGFSLLTTDGTGQRPLTRSLLGTMNIEFKDYTITLTKGEMFVVEKGVEHKPTAETECEILLIEPKGIINTGNAGGELTAPNDIWI